MKLPICPVLMRQSILWPLPSFSKRLCGRTSILHRNNHGGLEAAGQGHRDRHMRWEEAQRAQRVSQIRGESVWA